MTLTWRTASVELVEHYTLAGAAGARTGAVASARVAVEGGFVHVDVPGTGVIQVVSAPAVRLLTYKAEANGG